MRCWLKQRKLAAADVYCVILIVVILTVAFSPIFASLQKFPVRPKGADWLKECTFNRSARDAILRDHQFPLRSQYLGGGYPLVAYPEDSSLNPLFVTTLLFGENVGLKLRVFIKLLVGALGMYYLLRVSLGCPPGGAAIGSLLFGLADWFHARTGYGYIGWHNYCFLPLMMGTLLAAARGRCSIALPSVLFVLMLIDGKYVIAVSLLFLCLWGLTELVQVRRAVDPKRRAIVLRVAFFEKLAMVVCVGCLLAMVKILPMLQLLRANPRTLSYAVLVSESYEPKDTVFAAFYDFPALGRALITPGGLWEHHIGVGWIPVALALIAAIVHARFLARWIVLLVLFVWLSLGYHAPVDSWRLLWHLPVFAAMNKPAFCISFLILMPLCVLAASVFRETPRSMAGRWAYGAYLCIGGVAVALMLHNAFRANSAHFTRVWDAKLQAGPFYQVEGSGKYHLYRNTVQNIGSIDWDGDILLPEYAVPAYFIDEDNKPHRNPKWRGEVWFARGRGSVRATRFTATVIALAVEASEPATIIVNQNFDPGWRSSRGQVTSHNGLLAVRDLPPGSRYVVTLKYSSRALLIGLAASAISLAGLVWWTLSRMRRSDRRAGTPDTEAAFQRRPREVAICFGAWSVRARRVAAVGCIAALAALAAITAPRLRTDYILHRAQLLHVGRDTKGAAELCRRVLRQDPGNRLARDILGNCYYDDGRWQEAVDELTRAVRLGGAASHAYLMLARSHRRLGQLAEAERVYRELLAEYPARRPARKEFEAFRFELQQARRSSGSAAAMIE